MKNKLGKIRHFGKIVQFVRDFSTAFAAISILIETTKHYLTQFGHYTVGEVVKLSS